MSDHPIPLPVPSPELEARLAGRRSGSAQLLASPGPDAAQVDRILELGARTPDHGKLFPWRFVVLGPESRAGIAARLQEMAESQPEPRKAMAVIAKLTAAPVTILVISTPRPGKIPVWEQYLSAGAVCMNIEHAAGALGFSASWITDWYSYDPAATVLFGVNEGETVAGFIHIGTLETAPLERPRPDLTAIVTRLS